MMHPIGQFEIADSELGLVEVKVKRVESGFIEIMKLPQLCVEPGNRVEPVPLKGIIQGLAEIEVFQSLRSGRTGKIVPVIRSGSNGRQRRRCEQQRCQ